MNLQRNLKGMFRKFGYDVIKFDMMSSALARKRSLFHIYGINLVFDVGANEGQFAEYLRRDIGYKHRIVSFEPLPSVFELLKVKTMQDALWQAVNVGLGDRVCRREINVSINSQSSSFLNILPSHLSAAPQARYIRKELASVTTLDNVFTQFYHEGDNVFLKLDTQGFEKRILQGSANALHKIDNIQLEMSLVPLYEEEPTLNELLDYLRENGFGPVSLEPVYFTENATDVLQIDAIFHRSTQSTHKK